jgi:hypothetical protein
MNQLVIIRVKSDVKAIVGYAFDYFGIFLSNPSQYKKRRFLIVTVQNIKYPIRVFVNTTRIFYPLLPAFRGFVVENVKPFFEVKS